MEFPIRLSRLGLSPVARRWQAERTSKFIGNGKPLLGRLHDRHATTATTMAGHYGDFFGKMHTSLT